MNEYLAQLYGTGDGYTEEDLEKVAAYDLLTKLAAEEGIDVNDLSDDQVEGMMAELTGAEDDGTYAQDDEGNVYGLADDGNYYPLEMFEDEEEKLAAAQMEEADFLGRVMAHSFSQEAEAIEMAKEAKVRGAYEVARSALVTPAKAGAQDLMKAIRGGKHVVQKGVGGPSGGKDILLKDVAKADQISKFRKTHALRAAKRLTPYAAGAGAVGTGGVLGAKALKKEAEAAYVEQLAEIAVNEYGLDPDDLTDEGWEQLAAVVEGDTLLKEAAYDTMAVIKEKKDAAARRASNPSGGQLLESTGPKTPGKKPKPSKVVTKPKPTGADYKPKMTSGAMQGPQISKSRLAYRRLAGLAKTRGGKAALIGGGVLGAGAAGAGIHSALQKRASIDDLFVDDEGYYVDAEGNYYVDGDGDYLGVE